MTEADIPPPMPITTGRGLGGMSSDYSGGSVGAPLRTELRQVPFKGVNQFVTVQHAEEAGPGNQGRPPGSSRWGWGGTCRGRGAVWRLAGVRQARSSNVVRAQPVQLRKCRGWRVRL